MKGFEPSTFAMAKRCMTAEPRSYGRVRMSNSSFCTQKKGYPVPILVPMADTVPSMVPNGIPALPCPAIIIRQSSGRPFFEAKFRYAGRQVKRRIGEAWLEWNAEAGGWKPRRGRVPAGAYDERRAHVRAAGVVTEYVASVEEQQPSSAPIPQSEPTFRDVAASYLDWLERVRGAKPATLRDHRSVLGEPGVEYLRGTGTTRGDVLEILGDMPATSITARDVTRVLDRVAATGASASTVNKYRARTPRYSRSGCARPLFPPIEPRGTCRQAPRAPDGRARVLHTCRDRVAGRPARGTRCGACSCCRIRRPSDGRAARAPLEGR